MTDSYPPGSLAALGGFSKQYSMDNFPDDHFPQHSLAWDTFCM